MHDPAASSQTPQQQADAVRSAVEAAVTSPTPASATRASEGIDAGSGVPETTEAQARPIPPAPPAPRRVRQRFEAMGLSLDAARADQLEEHVSELLRFVRRDRTEIPVPVLIKLLGEQGTPCSPWELEALAEARPGFQVVTTPGADDEAQGGPVICLRLAYNTAMPSRRTPTGLE